jgi:hypothetical protein
MAGNVMVRKKVSHNTQICPIPLLGVRGVCDKKITEKITTAFYARK